MSPDEAARPEKIAQAVRAARRGYQNARSRALYWSGNATFTGHRYSVRRQNGGPADEQYELAMCDCRYWEDLLEHLTGRRPKRYDPKRLCRERWGTMNKLIANRQRGKTTTEP